MTTKGNKPRPFPKRQIKTTQPTGNNMAKTHAEKTEQENE